jgi:DNA invertase Pin-like site-specific DNA recombinase
LQEPANSNLFARAGPQKTVEQLNDRGDTGRSTVIGWTVVASDGRAREGLLRAMFQVPGVFSEFEREMIRSRVNAGMARAKHIMETKGRYETKNGTVIKRFGRPGAEPHKLEEAKKLLTEGWGMIKVAKHLGLGTCTVQKLKKEMVAA